MNAEESWDEIISLLQKLEKEIRDKYPEYKEKLESYIENYYSKEIK